MLAVVDMAEEVGRCQELARVAASLVEGLAAAAVVAAVGLGPFHAPFKHMRLQR